VYLYGIILVEVHTMAMPTKPTPEKYCAYCGARLERKRFRSGVLESLLHFNRRKFCGFHCMALAFDAVPPALSIGASTAHYHARIAVAQGPCEVCGKTDALDVHHKDGDYRNHVVSNLMRICRSCHLKTHRARSSCMVCGKPQKGLGYCEKHYQRFRKYGNPLMFKRNQYDPVHLLSE